MCVINAGADTGDLIETFFFSSKADGMASCSVMFHFKSRVIIWLREGHRFTRS